MAYQKRPRQRLTNVKRFDIKTKKGNFAHVTVGKLGTRTGFKKIVTRSTGKGKRHTWVTKEYSTHYTRR